MDSFVVSARKYRPASFEMVVGQDTITQTLKNAITNKHLASAYLFCGPRGVGKTTCARIFAKTINCFNLSDNAEACDECESCKSFNSSRSYNIHELDAASNNSVDDIRSLSDKVRIPPQVGKYSIYIIDEVHMLSTAAFNAFLKTLEEPPAHAIFILATTEKNKILATILSRCQVFDFNRIKIEDIANKLRYVANNESVTIEEEALHVIAMKADGAMRDALSIFDQLVSLCGKVITYKDVIANLNVLDYEYYFKVTDAILNGNVSDVLLTFNEIITKGFDGYNFLLGLNNHFRNLLVSKDPVTVKLIETTPAVRQQYAEQAARCQIPFLYSALDIGSNFDISYKSSKNPRLHIELALIKLCSFFAAKDVAPEKKNSELVQPVAKQESPVQQVSSKIASSIAAPRNIGTMPERHKSLSIKDAISSSTPADNEIVKPAADRASRLNDVAPVKIDATIVKDAWTKFKDLHGKDSTRVASMFNSIEPVYDEATNSVEILLKNIAQKESFVMEYKHRLIAYFNDNLGTSNLNVNVRVEEIEKEELLYTDEQKLKYLLSGHPILNDFLKEFQLTV